MVISRQITSAKLGRDRQVVNRLLRPASIRGRRFPPFSPPIRSPPEKDDNRVLLPELIQS